MLIAAIFRQLVKTFRNNNLYPLSFATLLVVSLGTIGGYLAEKSVNGQFANFGDSLWWTIVTLSTVGYGDKVPVTVAGHIIGAMCMVAGPVIMVSFIGSIGVHIYDNWMKGVRGMAKVKSKRHLIICGWNRKAEDIINELHASQLRDIPINIVDDTINAKPIDSADISFVKGNASELKVLERANIAKARFAIILAENATPAADQKTVLTALAIKKSNASVIMCAELNDANNREHLRAAGCEIIINAYSLSGKLLAMSLLNPAVNLIIEDLISQEGNEIYCMPIPAEYLSRRFIDILSELKESRDMIAIGIERNGNIILNPGASESLASGDQLLIISEESPLP